MVKNLHLQERQDRFAKLIESVDEAHVSGILDDLQLDLVRLAFGTETLLNLRSHGFHGLWQICVLLSNDTERLVDPTTDLAKEWSKVKSLATKSVTAGLEAIDAGAAH